MKAILILGFLAASTSISAYATVNTSGDFNLNVGAYGSGTQNVAAGKRTNKDGNNFSILLPQQNISDLARAPSFRCDSGYSQSGLMCSGSSNISPTKQCEKSPTPSYSMIYCNVPTFSYSTCKWKWNCQGGQNLTANGIFKSTCPSGYSLSGNVCKKTVVKSAKPYCLSGWRLSGYICLK